MSARERQMTNKKKRSASKVRGLRAEASRATCRNAKDGVLTAGTYHGRQTMTEGITAAVKKFIGLDVHKDTIAAAVADVGRDEPRFLGTVGSDLGQVLKILKKQGKPEELLVVYEAGPTGYVLARHLRERGYACEVIAPNKMPRRQGDRLKTDRRDALTLARLSRSGDLVNVHVPDAADESMRDLSRAREDAVRARQKARQQLKGLLLRHGFRYAGKKSWTAAHERYLASLKLPGPAQQIAFTEYRHAVREGDERVARLTDALRDQAETWRLKPLVHALMTLRGIDFIAAVTLVAEIGDFKRFARAVEVMGFLGLIPSEYSTGETRRQGGITKNGNGHARRVLVEAAWNYRHPANIGVELQKRQEGQPKAVRDIAWKAQQRLARRFRQLNSRGMQRNKICVAIARELSGFVWDIARQVTV